MGDDSVHIKPFILAKKQAGSIADALPVFAAAVAGAGFEVIGTYSPNPLVAVLCLTNDAIKAVAAKSERGGFGSVVRVALTSVKDEIQVSYTNAKYLAFACRLEGDFADVASKLEQVLGKEMEFGSAKGLTEKKLRKYHYNVGMEYFNEPETLAKYGTHEEAVAACEAALAAGKGGVTKIYRVDIPGKKEVVYGCGLKAADKYADDNFVMNIIDHQDLKHSAHLPYEMMVSEHKVIMLHARFRIAVNFPDLEMTGDHGFTKIMETPSAIKKALTSAAGGK